MPEQRERWGGRLAFVMAAIGSAVGLGNVWRFPATAFKNGGGAFLIPYFVALLTAGVPIMIVEYALGQKFQRGAPGAIARVNPKFRWVGWFALFVGTVITFYYVVIMAYSWQYMVASPTRSWTRPASFPLPGGRRAPADRIVLYHPYQNEEERLRVQAVEARKPASRRLQVYSRAEARSLSAREEHKSDAERRYYVPVDKNISNYFMFSVLGWFDADAWQTKCKHNVALETAAALRARAPAETAVVRFVQDGMKKSPWDPFAEHVLRLMARYGEPRKDAAEALRTVLAGQVARADRSRIVARIAELSTLDEKIDGMLGKLAARETVEKEPYLRDMFSPVWHLVIWSFVTWAIIFVIVAHGVKNVGRVVMVTVPLPVLLLLVLLIRGITLEGASEGLVYYLRWDPSALTKPGTWLAAYGQVFFSLSLGFGIMIAYASYVPDRSDLTSNAFITSFMDAGTSFFAGFAVFSTLGYLAYLKGGVPVKDVVAAGPGLVFVTYPIALAKIPGVWGALVGVLFFLCLLSLGIDSAFSIVEAVMTGFVDAARGIGRVTVTAILCAAGFLFGLLFCTNSGLMWLDIVDNWMSNYGLVMVGLLECIAVGYFFDLNELKTYANDRSEFRLQFWFDLFVKVITPGILIYLLAHQFYNDIESVYGGYDLILPHAVALGGWGVFFLLLFLALIIGRNWITLAWVVSGLVVFGVLQAFLKNRGSAAMGALGCVLLFGGAITCILLASGKRSMADGAGWES